MTYETGPARLPAWLERAVAGVGEVRAPDDPRSLAEIDGDVPWWDLERQRPDELTVTVWGPADVAPERIKAARDYLAERGHNPSLDASLALEDGRLRVVIVSLYVPGAPIDHETIEAVRIMLGTQWAEGAWWQTAG